MTTNLIEQARIDCAELRVVAGFMHDPLPRGAVQRAADTLDQLAAALEQRGEGELPPLPMPAHAAYKEDWVGRMSAHGTYTADQLKAYARAALAQQARPQPLPDHEIVTMYDEGPTCDADMIRFARAIERAHGIGGPNE